MHQQQRQPPQPAEVRQRVVVQSPGARQSQAGQRHQSQAEQRHGTPLFAQGEQRPQRHAQRRHQQGDVLAHFAGHEADDLAQRSQRPPTSTPNQQQPRQALKIESAQRQAALRLTRSMQSPGTNQRRQRQHRRSPETGMGQRLQALAGQWPEQRRAAQQESRTADDLQ
ncbi:hypothetical protein D9M71_424040 [compost metagenome]